MGRTRRQRGPASQTARAVADSADLVVAWILLASVSLSLALLVRVHCALDEVLPLSRFSVRSRVSIYIELAKAELLRRVVPYHFG